MTATPSGKKLIDFKQNMAGYVSFEIIAKAGQRIIFRFGEMLENDELTQKNIQCSSKIKTTPCKELNLPARKGLMSIKQNLQFLALDIWKLTRILMSKPIILQQLQYILKWKKQVPLTARMSF